ncbi:hypothetical protein PR003_g24369 [Phytophthora rubi]|uniref:Crinkler effector protein N-terminal domain-containing protein n=1 Tax=Phytophthora rubi TaxID=129364 RepID=A0A6A4CNI6_9STRA|nr:hypothetical protein PR003_g24369 [Phytophthora rubi]
MWFELVNRNGQPLGPADKLQGPLANVTDFRRALKGSRSSSADLDGVKASLLKVYRDRETYEKRISLAANDSIEGLGKEMETALIVEVPKVWFQLMDGGSLKDPICVPLCHLRVEDLCSAAKAKFGDLLPKTVRASDLKVYQDLKEHGKPAGGTPLSMDSGIEKYGKSRENALIVVPKIWFQLMDSDAHRAVTGVASVPFSELGRVSDLCAAAKTMYKGSILKDVEASELKVYKNMKVYKDQAEGGLLSADSIVNEHGKTSRSALILEGPAYASLLRKRPGADIRQLVDEDTTKRQKQEKLLRDFEKLTVNEDEFQLEKLHSKQQSEHPIVMTPGMQEFWEGFGDFPPYYFVRMEEVVFWQLIKKLLPHPTKRIVIVGSPGVGKSCFLMLVAFYLACVEKKKVLLIRRVIQKKLSNVVVLFDGQGSYARVTNVPRMTMCKVFSSTSGHSKTVVAYIQVTTQKEKKFKPDRLKRLNEEIDKHPQLKDLKRAFVVVGPDSNVCKTFHLRDAPDQGAFLTVVSCFDPDLL